MPLATTNEVDLLLYLPLGAIVTLTVTVPARGHGHVDHYPLVASESESRITRRDRGQRGKNLTGGPQARGKAASTLRQTRRRRSESESAPWP
jgi:hypothetical protein